MAPISIAILTVSDSCFRGEATDRSGPAVEDLITNKVLISGATVVARRCVPDEVELIKEALLKWCKEGINVVLTTGGTGFSPRDVTPEATRQIMEKETPGISIAMMKYSLEVAYPHAMLSRAISGVHGTTLIINLPGSSKGAQECLSAVIPCIPHAVAILTDQQEVKSSHSILQTSEVILNTNNSNNMNYEEKYDHICSKSKVGNNIVGRPRTSPFPMVDVAVAQSEILQAVDALEVEVVGLRDALGRILAEDVFAKDPLPPFPASIKDGYAVIAADGMGDRTVLGTSAAGEIPGGGILLPLQCVRITTGAAVPLGADSVVQVEDTQLVKASQDGQEELVIRIKKSPFVGEDIRPIGYDIKSGQQVLSAGCILGAPELGLLASVGKPSLRVRRLPKVAVLSTGNELQDPNDGEDLKAGCVRDSNKTTIVALLQQHGFPFVDMGIAIDEPGSLLDALEQSLARSDVVVSTGGVSMGEKDLLKHILVVDLKATIHFGRINMKPGKPTTFATCNFRGKKRLIFGLPGNPVSAFVTSHLLVLPALRALTGHPSPLPSVLKAMTTEDLPLDARPEYHRAVLKWPPGASIPVATSTGNQVSSRLLSCLSSNCILALPSSNSAQCSSLEKGTLIDAILLH